MSNLTDRVTYFENIAKLNKLVAHEGAIEGTEQVRKSFYRINNEQELNASCVNWAHFPCIVHIGHSINYRENGTGLPKKVVTSHLYILARTNNDIYPTDKAAAIDQAYEDAETVLNQVISYIKEDKEENGTCGGDLFLFDLNRAKAEMIGPINEILYGWYFIFQDEPPSADDFKYNANHWNT